MSGNEAGLIPARFSAYLVPGSLVTQASKHTNTTGWIMREHPNPTVADSYTAGKAALSVPSRGSQTPGRSCDVSEHLTPEGPVSKVS